MKNPKIFQFAIAFLNFFGLGLGTILLKIWKRAILGSAIALGLVAAFLIIQDTLFLIILSVWLLLLAFDGWKQSGGLAEDEGMFTGRPWLPFVIGIAFIALYVIGGISYVNSAQLKFDNGMSAYLDANCPLAVDEFNLVRGTFKYANPKNTRTAEDKVKECDYLIIANNAFDNNEYLKAATSIDTYLSSYPKSPIFGQMVDQAAGVYFQWADGLKEDEKYQEAIDTYEKIPTYYPAAATVDEVPGEVDGTYVEWAESYHENEEYETAVETYTLVLDREPEAERVSQVEEKMGEVYLDFAAALRIQDDFEGAISKYQIILDDYSDTVAAGTAESEIPATYLQWGNLYLADKEYEDALDILSTVIKNYPKSAALEDAKTAMVQAYLGLGQELAEKKRFNASIKAYEEIPALTTNAEILALVDTGISTTLALLSQDTGSEGSILMKSVLRVICENEPNTSPAVNTIAEGEHGKYLTCDEALKGFDLPESLEAQYPGEFSYAIKVSIASADLDSAKYGATGLLILIRRRVDWVVTVIKVETGDVWVIKTFKGGNPGSFPSSYRFGSNPDYLVGSAPSLNEIFSWLDGIN